MIATINPAFALLRKYKQCDPDTENLVMKKFKNRVSQDDLITIFEKGVSGEYGRFIQADPQTLIGWISKFLGAKNNSENYLSAGLLSVDHPAWDNIEWNKEVNKCYTAFLNGVHESNFHPAIYDWMLLDGRIELNAYLKHFKETGDEPMDIRKAKQTVIRNLFLTYKSNGWNTVYFIVK